MLCRFLKHIYELCIVYISMLYIYIGYLCILEL